MWWCLDGTSFRWRWRRRCCTRAQVADLAPTVSRVYPGTDGRLVYVPDEQGNTIHDSSHAGYAGGGVPIPTVPVKLTIWPVAGDNTEHVQAAIDKVSALPQDKSGFRGAVLLRAGYYKMAMPRPHSGQRRRAARRGHGRYRHHSRRHWTGRPPAPAGAAGPGAVRRAVVPAVAADSAAVRRRSCRSPARPA